MPIDHSMLYNIMTITLKLIMFDRKLNWTSASLVELSNRHCWMCRWNITFNNYLHILASSLWHELCHEFEDWWLGGYLPLISIQKVWKKAWLSWTLKVIYKINRQHPANTLRLHISMSVLQSVFFFSVFLRILLASWRSVLYSYLVRNQL